jgi:hypothetical protein
LGVIRFGENRGEDGAGAVVERQEAIRAGVGGQVPVVIPGDGPTVGVVGVAIAIAGIASAATGIVVIVALVGRSRWIDLLSRLWSWVIVDLWWFRRIVIGLDRWGVGGCDGGSRQHERCDG